MSDDSKCGERRGYIAHIRAGEKPCPPCQLVHNAYQATYREKLRANEGLSQRAAERAAERLAQAVKPRAPVDLEGALCAQADPDLWFPEKGDSTALAKAICRRCPVRADCLREALDLNDPWGIWGGKSPKERRPLKKLRRVA